MSSKMKPHEMRQMDLAGKPHPIIQAYGKAKSKKESQQLAIQARQKEAKRQQGFSADGPMWFMAILAVLFITFGLGYEQGIDRKNNPKKPIQIECIKEIKGEKK